MNTLFLETKILPSGDLVVLFIEQLPTFRNTLLITVYDKSYKDRVNADFEALKLMDKVQRDTAIAKMRLEMVIQPVVAPQQPALTEFDSPVQHSIQPAPSSTDAQMNIWLD